MLTKNNHKLLRKIFKNLNNRCPDEYIAEIEITSNTVNLTENYICSKRDEISNDKRRDLGKNSIGEKVLCIVLESPHNDEFSPNGKPLGPARGQTGLNLESKLFDKLKKFYKDNNVVESGKYAVILMNAVQYKCSLGASTKYYRDRVWLNLWFNGAKDDFERRIKSYDPDIVLNLCTNGNHLYDPLYYTDNKTNLENIRVGFINEVDKNMIQDSAGNLNKKSELYFCFNFIKGNYQSNNKYVYPLKGFVNTSLCKLANNFILLEGSHPASATWFTEELELKIKW